jgi:uncharacterized protein
MSGVLLTLENSLLYPCPKYPAGDWLATYLPHEDVFFASADGTRLHGWFIEHPTPQAVVLYLHGNGDHVAFLGPYLKILRDELRLSLFAIDYRGWGRSEGRPAEAGIMADARAAHDWLLNRTGLSAAQVVLFGRSLGGGVAVDLAAERGARGIVLQNTFTNIPDVAARLFPWIPVRLLMTNRYDSLSKIGQYEGPAFFSHGTDDTLVPYELGRKLYDATPGPKEFFVIAGGGHNSPEPPEYYGELDRWLSTLP